MYPEPGFSRLSQRPASDPAPLAQVPVLSGSARPGERTGIYPVTRDIRLTQDLLGHQSPDTTAIYVAWAAVDAAPAVAALHIGTAASA